MGCFNAFANRQMGQSCRQVFQLYIPHQAIIATNDVLVAVGSLAINLIEISIVIQNFSFRKCIWKCRLQNNDHCV